MYDKISASPAQLRYADTMFYGGLIGMSCMFITYALYVCGILAPQIPRDQLPAIWTHSAAEYRQAGNIPQGWGWLALIGKGDIANFIGIVLLAALTILCYIQLTFSLLRQKNWILSGIAL